MFTMIITKNQNLVKLNNRGIRRKASYNSLGNKKDRKVKPFYASKKVGINRFPTIREALALEEQELIADAKEAKEIERHAQEKAWQDALEAFEIKKKIYANQLDWHCFENPTAQDKKAEREWKKYFIYGLKNPEDLEKLKNGEISIPTLDKYPGTCCYVANEINWEKYHYDNGFDAALHYDPDDFYGLNGEEWFDPFVFTIENGKMESLYLYHFEINRKLYPDSPYLGLTDYPIKHNYWELIRRVKEFEKEFMERW